MRVLRWRSSHRGSHASSLSRGGASPTGVTRTTMRNRSALRRSSTSRACAHPPHLAPQSHPRLHARMQSHAHLQSHPHMQSADNRPRRLRSPRRHGGPAVHRLGHARFERTRLRTADALACTPRAARHARAASCASASAAVCGRWGFELRPTLETGKRTWYFRAGSEEERIEWAGKLVAGTYVSRLSSVRDL